MYIPKNYKEVEPGLFLKDNPVNSDCDHIVEHYRKETATHIIKDLQHYNALHDAIMKDAVFRYLPGSYEKLLSIGGGVPKFECSVVLFDDLIIADPLSYIYAKHLRDFKSLYKVPNSVNITYHSSKQDPHKIEGVDAVVFCHFLEHLQDIDDLKVWIGIQEIDIIIYSPNIGSARSESWVHFLDKDFDHNLFFTIEALTIIGENAGFRVNSMEYYDDLFIWMQK